MSVARPAPARTDPRITNCHVHTFTHAHAPTRFVRPPLNWLLRVRLVRQPLLRIVRLTDRGRRGRLARYGEVLETSYNCSQEDVFKRVQGFYPRGTRFVVLPMDMVHMQAGPVPESIEKQHADLAELRDKYPEVVIPFAAVDPRRDDVVATTIELIERHGFLGIKLYPPLGYHPNDAALQPLYAYADRHGVPVLAHCSPPAGVSYRGPVTDPMRTDPMTGERLDLNRAELLKQFTNPETYRPILDNYPRLRLCLAHFGGPGEWKKYLEGPWNPEVSTERSWLASIADMIRLGDYPNLWTDISYTVFADDEYVYMLKVLLSDERIRRRVLFGSDFYVVADAKLEERRRALRIRAVLGEDAFRQIAEENPREYLGAIAGEPRPETIASAESR